MSRTTNKIAIETKCLSCGEKVTETLGRFKKKPMPVCPSCGGKLDEEPLRQFALKVVRDFRTFIEKRNKLSNIKK
jgi:hypothetical protein